MKFGSLLLVGCGGFLGAITRYLVAVAVGRGHAWPYGTFLINVTGCFLLGLFVTVASERVTLPEGWSFFFPVGFVGAYTTFSTYEYELHQLTSAGAYARAATYFVFSNALGFGAMALATYLARRT